MKHVISLDWLEYYVHIQDYPFFSSKKEFECGRFRAVPSEFGTRFFSRQVTLYDGSFEMAIVQCSPRASFINAECGLIKIANRVLYCQNCFSIIDEILRSIDCKIEGITRIDLACDLLTFENGYKPHKFIKDFVGKDKDEDGYIHHYGCREFSITGDKKAGENSKFSYIRFGSRKSAVQTYLYNKSKEMRDKVRKQYIEEIWKANGLYAEKTDVWRVEISIKAEGLNVLVNKTGELFKIGADYIDTQGFIEAMFYAYARKYFHFGVKNGQKRAKDYNELMLITPVEEVVMRPISISKKMNTGRTEKIVSKKLKEVSDTYIDLAGYYRQSIKDTIEFFDTLSANKDKIYRDMKERENLLSLIGDRFCEEDGLQRYSETEFDDMMHDLPPVRRR